MSKTNESNPNNSTHRQPSWLQLLAYHLNRLVALHPKSSVCLILGALAFCSGLFYLPSEPRDCNQPLLDTHSPRTSNLSVPGIYYCQLVAGQPAHGAAVNVEPIQGPDCYQLILAGRRYPFSCDFASGKIDCQMLGPGSIYIDKCTNEIIIEFEGWKLKRLS